MNSDIAYYRVAVGVLVGGGGGAPAPARPLGCAERKQCRRYWSVSV